MSDERKTIKMPWTPEEFLAKRRDEAGTDPGPIAPDRADLSKVLERISDLEKRLEELESHRVFAVDREYDRQARWHAHRLGVLCAAIQKYGWDYLKESESSAIDAADRAHGPLEGKVEGGKVFMTAVGPLTVTQWDEKVSALVKVARKASDFLREGAADECDMGDELAEALKPFEVTP